MNRKVKKLILPNIPYVFFGLLGTKLGETFRLAPGTDFAGKLRQITEGLNAAFQSPLPSFHPFE